MSDCDCIDTKCPDGIPAWVMTFADLMSLLLAFFVLLFSFSEMDKNIYKELAGSMKDAFGVQREIQVKESPRGINIIAREFSPGRPQPTVSNEVRQMTTDDSKLHPVFTDPAKEGQENQSKKTDDAEDKSYNAMHENVTKDRLTVEEREIAELVKQDSKLLRETLDEEITQDLVDMRVTQTRIILMVREKGSFPSGRAEVIEPFKIVAKKISRVFSDFDGIIIVSGHTDNIPIRSYRFRSNWELSSSRAVSVIHELVKEESLANKQFEIAAFADTRPVDSNDTPVGRAKNRRVEITMDYSSNQSRRLSIEANKSLTEQEQMPESK